MATRLCIFIWFQFDWVGKEILLACLLVCKFQKRGKLWFFLNWRSRRRSCQGWSWFIPDHLINFPPITGFACTPCQTFWFLGTQLLIEKPRLRSRMNNTFSRKEMYRVCQNNALSVAGATVDRRNHHLPASLVYGDWFFWSFLAKQDQAAQCQW